MTKIRIEQAIVHRIDPHHQRGPVLSEEALSVSTELQDFLGQLVLQHLQHTLIRRGRFLKDSDEVTISFKSLCDRILDDAEAFVKCSQAIASRLFQTVAEDRRVTATDLFVCVFTDSNDCVRQLGLLCMQPGDAIAYVSQGNGNSQSPSFERLPGTLLNTDLQKCAFVLPSKVRHDRGYDVVILDRQTSRKGYRSEIAQYFVRGFLNCELEPIEELGIDESIEELLSALGFVDILSTQNARAGYDLRAIYPTRSPTGEPERQSWLIKIQRGLTSGLDIEELRTLSATLLVHDADRGLFITRGILTSSAGEFATRLGRGLGRKLEVWDRDGLSALFARFPELQRKYSTMLQEDASISHVPLCKTSAEGLEDRLGRCPRGIEGWKEFEEICMGVLTEVFVPPLREPRYQARTVNGLERRDALFGLRGVEGNWQQLAREFDANFLLFEFKNLSGPVTKEEVNQTCNYLKNTIGRIGFIISREGADEGAIRMRNSIYTQNSKVILIFGDRHLTEMLRLKYAGQNPLDLIQAAIDDFYVSYE